VEVDIFVLFEQNLFCLYRSFQIRDITILSLHSIWFKDKMKRGWLPRPAIRPLLGQPRHCRLPARRNSGPLRAALLGRQGWHYRAPLVPAQLGSSLWRWLARVPARVPRCSLLVWLTGASLLRVLARPHAAAARSLAYACSAFPCSGCLACVSGTTGPPRPELPVHVWPAPTNKFSGLLYIAFFLLLFFDCFTHFLLFSIANIWELSLT
jgi:hypothetical protein